jgi:septation ring formation regulator EzrA
MKELTENLSCMEDAIETSVNRRIFNSVNVAFQKFLTNTTLTKLNLKNLQLKNFEHGALKAQSLEEVYILLNKENANSKNVSHHQKSIEYHMNKIKNKQKLTPIYVVKKSNVLTLLDGAHRIIGSYYSGKFTVPMYLIEI